MDNEIVTTVDTTAEIIDNASRFAEFLSSDTVAPIRKSISIIPSAVKTILESYLENKQIKLIDRNNKRKAELAMKFLEFQDDNSKRNYSLGLEKIRADSEVAIRNINKQYHIDIAEIEAAEKQRLAEIASNEVAKLAELKVKHDLEIKRMDNEKEVFLKTLNESNKRFNRQMKNVEKTQRELQQLIDVLIKKITTGTVTEYEYKLLESLSSMKIRAMEQSFNISEGFFDMFSRRD